MSTHFHFFQIWGVELFARKIKKTPPKFLHFASFHAAYITRIQRIFTVWGAQLDLQQAATKVSQQLCAI